MDTSSHKKLTCNKEMLIKQLVQGHEFGTQLQILLNDKNGESGLSIYPGSDVVGDLLVKILKSFTETLTAISSSDVACQNNATSGSHVVADSICTDDIKSENSDGTKKRPTTHDRRGCYKRKKIAQSRTVASLSIEDGYAWRKYGQKEILNSKFPRSYYRCTHKYDQGCKATKQVQRMEDDPDMYHTMYIDHHTCNSSSFNAPEHITPQDSSTCSSGFVIQGAYATGLNAKVDPKAADCYSFGSCRSEMKQEFCDEEQQGTQEVTASSCIDDTEAMWKDVFEPFDHLLEPHCGDFASTLYSAPDDSVIKSVDFSCDFDFDHEFQFI